MDVIAQIAGRAALEVGGVHAVDGGIQGGIAAVLGRDNSGSGIKVQLEDNALIINANIITRYGERIPEVAWNLQEHIKKSVEDKVGITVQKVNVLITGVKLPKENYE
ncbi:MAG: Asp23/Gls24 family envelope stress response protein [Oscillospiraceae bacterium]|nr:Asp23/Gls24 family envelope stress response protein [Oscillospiraceae bacterium]